MGFPAKSMSPLPPLLLGPRVFEAAGGLSNTVQHPRERVPGGLRELPAPLLGTDRASIASLLQTKDAVFTLSAMTSGIRRNWIEALRKNVRPVSAPDVTK